MTSHVPTASRAQAVIRRVVDLLVAVPAALVLAPLMVAVACAIWVETGRPILFRQIRLGKAGRPFVMLKFRKFGRDPQEGGALTRQGDPRMTDLGRILMVTKLDELPQLWNVIAGDMALVGPRPESLAFADCFEGGLERLLDHKPGLLGPCQILFRNEGMLFPPGGDPEHFYRTTLFPLKARIDLDYLERRTLIGDIGIMLRGVISVIFPKVPDASRLLPAGYDGGASSTESGASGRRDGGEPMDVRRDLIGRPSSCPEVHAAPAVLRSLGGVSHTPASMGSQ